MSILGNKKQGLFYWLAWRDSFRTFNWEKAFPDPTISLREIQGLLAFV